MIRLPDIPALQGTNVNMPQMRAGAAQALGEVASAIAGVSAHFQSTAEQIQKLENGRMLSEGRNDLATQYSNLAVELERDQDPVSRIQRTRDFFTAYKSQMESAEHPPIVREALLQHFDDFATRALIGQTQDSARLAITRSVQAADNELARLEETGDVEGAVGVVRGLGTVGAMTPEQVAGKEREIRSRFALLGIQKEMQHDAVGWVESHKRDDVPAGVEQGKWYALYDHAQTLARAQTHDAYNTVLDGIAGGKITEKEIDGITTIRPALKRQLVGYLHEAQSEAYKARMQTPEGQAEVIGRFSALMSAYKPADPGTYDTAGAELGMLVRSLPTEGDAGAVRAELAKALTEAQAERTSEARTYQDVAKKTLVEHYKKTVLDKIWDGDSGMPTERAIHSGFIARENLEKLGLSKKQITEVLGTEVTNEKLEPKDKAARVNRFRRVWSFRENQNAHPGGLLEATALAIVNGETQIKFATTEDAARGTSERMAAEIKLGKLQLDLHQWFKLNPKATPAEIDDKLLKLTGENLHVKLSQSLLPARPAAFGDRITSYGYPGDSTPDRNSAAGIGAWVGDAEAARIRSGMETPNKLKPGDLAVSRDVEARMRAAGVTPGQRVRLTLSDGKSVVGRWMDRTADSYKGHTLKNRFDLYSPDGESELDGRRVVNWNIEP